MKNILEQIDKQIAYYAVGLIIFVVFGYSKFIIPQVNQVFEKKKQIESAKTELSTLQSQQQSANQQSALTQNTKKEIPVVIYTSPYPGLDIENASVDLVDQLIRTIRTTGNRVIEISFTAKAPDSSISNASTGVLTLNMSLNCSYASLQNLLQKVSTWKYLAAIKDITISPEQQDYNNLSAKLTFDLYVNKT